MDDRTLRLLEFPKIRERVAAYALTAPGRERAGGLQPATDVETVRRSLQETAEAGTLAAEGGVPLRGTTDIRDGLRRAQIGAALEPAELLAMCDTLAVIRECKGFVLAHRERAPLLTDIARGMRTFETLERAIRRTVANDGSVPDTASPDLARIRREHRSAHARIREKLDDLVRGPDARMLQDPLVTTRGDRYVVPVRQEFKGQFPGVLHDQSSSGATAFMEPLAIVPLGNAIRELGIAEREEIIRLLRELVAEVAAEAGQISLAYEALGKVDFAVAKALLAQSMRGALPRVRTDGVLRLRRARHPLLGQAGSEPGGGVVPIDVWLGEEFTTLVITGPNTGGKTVTLKTIGLLTLMAQAGLHLPADEGSEINVFPQVFADIGDEQSIEQSLSTFSSHMGAIAGILNQLGDSSSPSPLEGEGRVRGPASALILLDEIGAGTDPTEGVALARSLIEHLHQLGVRTAVTTHYNELKALAYTHPGIQNASVEFDADTLRPTYRLLIGIPGRSNALSIAERLGLDAQIVERARDLLGPEVVAIDRVLSDIEADRKAYEYELAEASRHRQEASALRTRAEQELDRLRAERRLAAARLREEADALLVHARREVEAIVASLRAGSGSQAVQEARARLRHLAEELASKAQVDASPPGEPLAEVTPGQTVYVVPLNRTGTVLAVADSRDEIEVETGAMRVKVRLSALRAPYQLDPQRGLGDQQTGKSSGTGRAAPTAPVSPAPTPIGSGTRAPDLPRPVPTSLSLRGMTVDEAIPILDKYLDEAFVAGLRRVTIVHGKGTGALRKAVHDFLKNHPHVKSYRLGEKGEGETGATIVELDAS
ncbi:MAG: hypothetical protein AUI83_13430 [Armatimonadetes bacterium 13_1_40CM_3_65_7]|nr:MAG: hypothetical protein AUI83_13430 [Armatimonadetes bacterium 13_1_40CM_3_65_7]